MTDYSNAPTSITEAKAIRADDAAQWTPRDALVSMLRDIDAGSLEPTELVLLYREPKEGGHRCSMRQSGGDPYVTIAMLEFAKADVVDEG